MECKLRKVDTFRISHQCTVLVVLEDQVICGLTSIVDCRFGRSEPPYDSLYNNCHGPPQSLPHRANVSGTYICSSAALGYPANSPPAPAQTSKSPGSMQGQCECLAGASVSHQVPPTFCGRFVVVEGNGTPPCWTSIWVGVLCKHPNSANHTRQRSPLSTPTANTPTAVAAERPGLSGRTTRRYTCRCPQENVEEPG